MSDRRAHGGHSRARGTERDQLRRAAANRHFEARSCERVPAILYIADAGGDGRWHYVSPQIEEILGFTPEEWCADPGLWAEPAAPRRRERVLAERGGFADGGRSRPARSSTGCSTATAIPCGSATTRSCRDGHRRAQRWHGVMSDITEQKEAEAELELRAAQQAAVARLGEHALRGREPGRPHAGGGESPASELLEPGDRRRVWSSCPPRTRVVLPRRGIGLPDVGASTTGVPAGLGSQSGYALLSGRAGGGRPTGPPRRRFERSQVLERTSAPRAG